MASYQVVCSVIRPPPPTQRCEIPDFQEKAQQHISSVFHDVHMENRSSESSSLQEWEEASGEREGRDTSSRRGEDQILCALVSKAKASFSGEDNFQWKLPCFWCNFCPFGTESRPSLLQHLTSQHCFRCHHCPFVTLTRSAVAQHSLREHPEFERRAREQKLKECHLLRDIFQERFAPSTLPETPAKESAGRDSRATPGLATQHREDDGGSQGDGADAGNAFDTGFDSSSDSSDAPFLSGHRSEGQGTGQNSSAANCNNQHGTSAVSKTKSLSENIVSSSSMDMEAAGDVCVYPETGLESESPQGREYAKHGHGTKSDCKERLAFTVKQEVEGEESFPSVLQGEEDRHSVEGEAGWYHDGKEHNILHQMAATTGRSSEQHELCSSETQHSVFPVSEPMKVKTEPESEDEGFRTYTWEDRGSNVKERGSSSFGVSFTAPSSPPLSLIQVENLQRQFEESVRNTSLGLHASDRNVHPQPGCLRSHPRITAQDQLKRSGQISRQAQGQNIVDNFLLDPSTTTSKTESLTLLRNLLTRHETGDIVDRVSLTETHVHAACEPGAAGDDFLSGGHSVVESEQCGEGEQAGLDTGVQIKQEPEDEAFCGETYHDPNCATPFSEQTHFSAESPATVEHHVSESETMRSYNSMSADPNLSLRDILNRSCPRPEASDNLTQIRKHGESSRPDHRVMHTPSTPGQEDPDEKTPLSAADKLKALSHMTLRDILTMKVPLGLDLDSGSPSTSAVNVTEISMGDGDGRGEVVWECGFCDFSAVKKQEVMAHRKQWHGEYSLHSDTGSPYDASTDNTCEGEVFVQAGHSYGSKQHWPGHGFRGGHHRSPPVLQGKRKQGAVHSSPQAVPSRKRARGRGHKGDDYDYSYQSASPLSIESSSNSEVEEDDPEDRNYVPPHYLLDKLDSSGSESESGRPKKMRSGVTRKFHHKGRKGRKGQKENTGSSHHLPSSKQAGKPGHTSVLSTHRGVSGNVGSQGNGFYNLSHKYVCIYCDHSPSSLHLMKSHLRLSDSSDQQHRLIAEMTTYPYSVLFICPGDSCFFVSSSEKVYLEHVLPCQGLILDVSKKSLFEEILRNCEERPGKEGLKAFRCCVSSCGYSSSDVDTLRQHLQQHVDTFHTSQMLLMHTVCTAMANLSHTPDFVCYLCTEWMSSMTEASAHCEEKHEGRGRGVFHILRTEAQTDERPPGLLVSMICLQCRQQVPKLDSWFSHTCDDGDSGSSQGPDRHTTLSLSHCPPCSSAEGGVSKKWLTPPLDAWPWKIARGSAGDDGAENKRQNQLPLVRSILLDKVGMMSDKKNLSSRQEPSLLQILSTLGSSKVTLPTSRHHGQQDTCSHSSTADKDTRNKVTKPSAHSQLAAPAGVGPSHSAGDSTEASFTVCGECQESVSDTQWKYHKCFLNKITTVGEAEQGCSADAHKADGKTEGCQSGQKKTEVDQQKPGESDNTSVQRSHRLIAKRLQSSSVKASHAEDGDHDSSGGKKSSGLTDAALKSAMGARQKSSVSASSAATAGSQSLRSLLVGLPAGNGDALGKAVKQARGNTSLLRDRLLACGNSGPKSTITTSQKSASHFTLQQKSQESSSQRLSGQSRTDDISRTSSSVLGRSSPKPNSSCSSATSPLGVSPREGFQGSGSQTEVSNPDSPGGAQLGMGESSYMVNWLHQQGSQMMRVLGGAMPKDDDYMPI